MADLAISGFVVRSEALALTDLLEGEESGVQSFKLSVGDIRDLLQKNFSGSGASTTVLGVGATATAVGSVTLGDASTSTGQQSTTIGNNNQSTKQNNITVGYNIKNFGQRNVLIGSNITNSNGSGDGNDTCVVIGHNAQLGGTVTSGRDSFVAIGADIKCNWSNTVAIGKALNASVGNQNNSTMIGANQVYTAGGGISGEMVAIGSDITWKEGRNTLVGHGIDATDVSVTGMGWRVKLQGKHNIAIGRTAIDPKDSFTTDDHIVLGGAPGTGTDAHLWLGSGWAHRYTDGNGDIIGATNVPSTKSTYIHGRDAYDEIDGTSTNIAGGDLIIAAGVGTGSGVAGAARIQVASTGAGANVKNTLLNMMVITDGNINLPNIPTAVTGLVAGDIYSNSGVLTIV